jgi:hypothetical protein
MRAFKFLDADRRAPFTGVHWPPGVWIEETAAQPCRQGVHACTAQQLSHWLAADLWEVELDGEIVASRHKIVASRGRLVRRFDAYRTAARELAEVGAWRCRDRAVAALRAEAAGAALGATADAFGAAATLDDLASLGGGVDDTTFSGAAAALAADAAHFALHGNPAQSPFVAACSAGHAASGPSGDQAAYDAGYAAERAFQSAWLVDRLDLG